MSQPFASTSAPLRAHTTTIVDDFRPGAFIINATTRSYKHQYSNIYFVRLGKLRHFVEKRAARRWKDVDGCPVLVPRVLDVIKGKLCYIVGTVYMDMPLKPNVLEDVGRDHSIPAPPPREKFYSDEDAVTLEDESGRICLVGEPVRAAGLVTGVIMGALGVETPNGDFEVIDLCYAGMAPQKSAAEHTADDDAMDVDASLPTDDWIAMVSGFDIGLSSAPDAQLQMLTEYLTAEAGGEDEQRSSMRISRLIIAGNSLAVQGAVGSLDGAEELTEKKPRRYGYDGTTFSPLPLHSLSAYLLDINRSMPIHLLAGDGDPSGTILPQQPLPRAMFGTVSSSASFTCETNPTFLTLAVSSSDSPSMNSTVPSPRTRTVLVNSGQPLDDMFKYLPSPPFTRLALAAATLRWRHLAPTAPDTLWCHPFFGDDPFVLRTTPDVYIVGNQPRFQTRLVTEEASADAAEDGEAGAGGTKRCRLVLLPSFARTGLLVLVNAWTLEVRTVRFAVQGMADEPAPEAESNGT